MNDLNWLLLTKESSRTSQADDTMYAKYITAARLLPFTNNWIPNFSGRPAYADGAEMNSRPQFRVGRRCRYESAMNVNEASYCLKW